MRAMKAFKKFIFIIFAIFMLGTICYFYVNNIFLPIKFRKYIEQRAQEILGRSVNIGKLEFEVLKGFVISDIEIQKKEDDTKHFATIDELSFNILFAPIFKSKKVIIPTIRINDAVVFIERLEPNIWNFTDLLNKEFKEESKYTFLARKLSITDSLISYNDLSQSPSIEETFENINLEIALSLQKKITFLAETDLKHNHSKLSLIGNYDLDLKTLSSNIAINNFDIKKNLIFFNISPDPYLEKLLISKADLNATFMNKTLSASGNISFDDIHINVNEQSNISGDLRSNNFTANWKNNNLELSGIYELSNTNLVLDKNSAITANIITNISQLSFSNHILSVKGEFSSKGTKFSIGAENNYEGDLSVDDGFFLLEGDIFKFEGNLFSEGSNIAFIKDNSLKGTINAENIRLLKTKDSLKLKSNINIDKAHFLSGDDLDVSGDLILKDFSLISNEVATIYESNITLNNSDITLNSDLNLKGSIQSEKTEIVQSKDKTHLSSDIFIEGANLTIDNEKRLQANPNISLDLEYIPKSGPSTENKLQYTATSEFSNALITGIPKLKILRNIFGKVTLEPDLLRTDALTFNTNDTDIKLSGSLNGFSKPSIDIKTSSASVELETIAKIFPEIEERSKLKMSGKTSFALAYNGKIKDIAAQNISGTFNLNNAKIKLNFLPLPFTDIYGTINSLNDIITWTDLKGKYSDEPFTINGDLKKLSRPTVITDFSSDKLNFSTEIRPLRSAFRVMSLKGSFLKSRYDLAGDVHFFEDASPDIDLRGSLSLDLKETAENLSYIPTIKNSPEKLSLINKFSPEGTVAIEGLYKGKYDDFRNWQLVLKASSPEILLDKKLLKNMTLNYEQRDLHISKCNFNSNFYEGIFNLISSADLTQESIPSRIQASFNDINLSLMRKGFNLKNKLSGKGYLNVDLTLPLNNPKQSEGRGSLAIKEGYIWHWNILQSLSNAVLIPEFQKVYFTDASADFIIENEKIMTDNALLVGNTVDLTGKGWVDFSKNLNFYITPNFSQAVITQSSSLRKAPTALLTNAVTINLTGTLNKPAYKVETSPFKIIESTTEILKEGIGGILGEFF